MKKQIIGMLFLCFSVLYAGEANPQFFTFTIKNRILTGTQFESARTPVVKTVLQKDIFIVDLKTEFLGEENINLLEYIKSIPSFELERNIPKN